MPYIDQQDRRRLDPKIEILAEEIANISRTKPSEAEFSGLLNYVCTRLALLVLRGLFDRVRYWHVALVTGTFKNIADEYYRRIGTPYEDFCILKNGDVVETQLVKRQIDEQYQTLEH